MIMIYIYIYCVYIYICIYIYIVSDYHTPLQRVNFIWCLFHEIRHGALPFVKAGNHVAGASRQKHEKFSSQCLAMISWESAPMGKPYLLGFSTWGSMCGRILEYILSILFQTQGQFQLTSVYQSLPMFLVQQDLDWWSPMASRFFQDWNRQPKK